MWLAVLAGSLTGIPGVVGGSIRLTNNCPDVYVRPYAAATGTIPLANDTLVFLAIAWRVMKNANADKKTTWIRLEQVSRFLRSETICYRFQRLYYRMGKHIICEFWMHFSATSLADVFSLGPRCSDFDARHYGVHTYCASRVQNLFSIPNHVLMHMMVSRVFQHIKFGHFSQGSRILNSNILFSQGQRNDNIPPSIGANPPGPLHLDSMDGIFKDSQSTMPIDAMVIGDNQEGSRTEKLPCEVV